MTEARDRLHQAQANLLGNLLAGAEPPAQFEAASARRARGALMAKRERLLSRASPALSHALGARLAPEFRDFAVSRPGSPIGGPLEDSIRFARFLSQRGALPREAHEEWILHELHFRASRRGLRPRRIAFRWFRSASNPTLTVAVKVGRRYFIAGRVGRDDG